ncbi:PilN domain-containing protein [Heyndrickxia vini]|uniref:Fimbrial assembly family protein n=1 Tax=Heyndrickxia vini TaxID=1476025 RepID=A0ABX7E4Q4_9BACI|nr:PilN domain-containing protein [Heyndrickxia vini]QQZ10711.1 hypothetical protein I5776_07390 [Heyndrickxia vini]
MLVEINLIQKKETKSRAPFYIIIGIIFVAVILSVLFIMQINNKHGQIKLLESQIKKTEEFRIDAEQKLTSFESNDAYKQLKTSVDWAETVPVDTVTLLKQLVSYLPERGFFQTFSYNEDGSVNMTIQFDTSNDAAYYLSRLTSAKWVENAEITEITTNDIEKTDNKDTQVQEEIAEQENNVLPRYIVSYTITIDKQSINKLTEEETEDQSKGGNGP